MEDLDVRHRNQMRHHYTQTSNVLLFGYKGLSDGAKVTYQVVDSYDWTAADGTRKGYAFPSLRTLAQVRGVDRKTVQRHLAELERAGLLTREERQGRPSLLIIEDPSEEETVRYLAATAKVGEDKNVQGTLDKNVHPNKKSKVASLSKKYKPVNGDEPLREREREPESIGSVMSRYRVRLPDHANQPEERLHRDFIADELLKVLGDKHSLGYYRKVAAAYPEAMLFECLGQVREAIRNGKVQNRGALFVSLLIKKRTPVAGYSSSRDPIDDLFDAA
jgi:DNA-binding MarR family transcriptional regulator